MVPDRRPTLVFQSINLDHILQNCIVPVKLLRKHACPTLHPILKHLLRFAHHLVPKGGGRRRLETDTEAKHTKLTVHVRRVGLRVALLQVALLCAGVENFLTA